MHEEPLPNLLPSLNSRREYFDFLDRWTIGTVDDLRAQMTSRALVKAYLLETSRANGSRDAIAALRSATCQMSEVDETLYRMHRTGDNGYWALADVEDERYPVLYTALESTVANRRVDRLIEASPLLDRAWFAAPMFQTLWQLVLEAYPDHRFSQIVFEHDSVYEAFGDEGVSNLGADSEDEETTDDEVVPWVERRRARIQITERIGKLRFALPKMQPEYDPLQSIVCLRIPAARRGGHDVYFNGRFTNRSDSVMSLRQTISLVTTLYRNSTLMAEEASWPHPAETAERHHPPSLGLPLMVKFSKELDIQTFERWIGSLRRKNNRFRLWGNPIHLGRGKVHLYAVDNHLWQPIDLEITQDHLYALLPSGTCGNTIHRLVTNIQRFVDPKPEAYIGDQEYRSFVAGALPSD